MVMLMKTPMIINRKELEEMSEMRRHTNQLLQNLLPLHVAKFFLAEERISEDLFAEARCVSTSHKMTDDCFAEDGQNMCLLR